jgi:hypothetical protein
VTGVSFLFAAKMTPFWIFEKFLNFSKNLNCLIDGYRARRVAFFTAMLPQTSYLFVNSAKEINVHKYIQIYVPSKIVATIDIYVCCHRNQCSQIAFKIWATIEILT